MVSSKIAAVLALALGASLSLAEETCLMPSKRTMPGRDIGGFGNYVCPGTINACKALCPGGAVETNTCTNDSEYGEDNPFDWITYCYECTCADGSSPDLSPYRNTVPNYVCQRKWEDCQYRYNRYGGTAPDGACPSCGGDYAPGLEPHYSWETTTAAAEGTTSTIPAAGPTGVASTDTLTWTTVADEIPLTTETPSISTDDLTFITSTVPVATDATSLSSEAATLGTWTSSTLNSTASTTLSSVPASKTASQSSSSAAAVPTSDARMLEPALGLGMVMAVICVL